MEVLPVESAMRAASTCTRELEGFVTVRGHSARALPEDVRQLAAFSAEMSVIRFVLKGQLSRALRNCVPRCPMSRLPLED